MGTRALIGYLDTTQSPVKLTTTANQFDGYYERRFINKDEEEEIIPGLGSNLNKFYDSDSKAEEIANMGYISYIDSETGEGIDNSSNSSQPKKIDLPDNFNEAMMEIAAKIDGMSGNYGYIWDNENEEWITIENNGISSMAENLEMELAHLKDKFNIKTQDMNENVDVKGHVMMLLSKVKSQLEPEEKNMFNTYEESVMRDVKAGGSRLDQYLDFDVDDMMEDYKNYVSGRVDFDESFVNKMKYRAGIIK